MKKFIWYRFIWMLMALVMCLSLCACGMTTTDESGYQVQGVDRFIFIKEAPDNAFHYLCYDRGTSVVYYIDLTGDLGYVSPYNIYKDGAIYGAIYENGEIVPVPYALGITDEMIEDQFNNWFG